MEIINTAHNNNSNSNKKIEWSYSNGNTWKSISKSKKRRKNPFELRPVYFSVFTAYTTSTSHLWRLAEHVYIVTVQFFQLLSFHLPYNHLIHSQNAQILM